MGQLQFQYFPKNKAITEDLIKVVEVFSAKHNQINSENNQLTSNDVLSIIADDLESLGYQVERSKKSIDKILIPVLYGINGVLEQHFDADAYNKDLKIVVEVEAGRAVLNYQFLKDLFEACVMDNVDYLAIAVRKTYKDSHDFLKVITFFNTLFASNRLILPLKGTLIIGY